MKKKFGKKNFIILLSLLLISCIYANEEKKELSLDADKVSAITNNTENLIPVISKERLAQKENLSLKGITDEQYEKYLIIRKQKYGFLISGISSTIIGGTFLVLAFKNMFSNLPIFMYIPFFGVGGPLVLTGISLIIARQIIVYKNRNFLNYIETAFSLRKNLWIDKDQNNYKEIKPKLTDLQIRTIRKRGIVLFITSSITLTFGVPFIILPAGQINVLMIPGIIITSGALVQLPIAIYLLTKSFKMVAQKRVSFNVPGTFKFFYDYSKKCKIEKKYLYVFNYNF